MLRGINSMSAADGGYTSLNRGNFQEMPRTTTEKGSRGKAWERNTASGRDPECQKLSQISEK